MRTGLTLAVLVGLVGPALADDEPAPTQATFRHGLTGEIGLGWGFHTTSPKGHGAVLGLGLGWFVTDRLALMVRTVNAFEDGTNGDGSPGYYPIHDFTGPSAQLWIDDHFWLGGGVGWGSHPSGPSIPFSDQVFGFDARIGASLGTSDPSASTLDLSVELMSGLGEAHATGVVALVGYQHL